MDPRKMQNTLFKNLEVDSEIDGIIPPYVQPHIAPYCNLSDLHKSILHVMALAHFSLNFESLRQCIGNLNHFFPFSDHFSPHSLTSSLESLRSKKFLTYARRLSCHLEHFLTLQALKSPLSQKYLEIIQNVSKNRGNLFYTPYSDTEISLNQLRLALYTNQEKVFYQIVQQHTSKGYISQNIVKFFTHLFLDESLELEWIKTRPLFAQQLMVQIKVYGFCMEGKGSEHIQEIVSYYQSLRDNPEFSGLNIGFLIYDILSGDIQRLKTLLTTLDPQTHTFKSFQGTFAFLSQQDEEGNKNALIYYGDALKTLRKVTRFRNSLLDELNTLFYILALFRSKDKQLYKKIQAILDIEIRHPRELMGTSVNAFQNLLWKLQGQDEKVRTRGLGDYGDFAPLVSAMVALVDFWLEEETTSHVDLVSCKSQFEEYKNSLPLVSKIFAEILCNKIKDKKEIKPYKEYCIQERFKESPAFLDSVQMGEVWERKLGFLDGFFERLNPGSSKKSDLFAKAGDKRLVWQFDPNNRVLEVVEQSALAKGKWSRGRPVSLKRLYESQKGVEFEDDFQDKKIISTLRKTNSWSQPPYVWSPTTPLALVGHPRVYHRQHPDRRLEFILSSPELIIKEIDNDKFHISLSHIAESPQIFIEAETSSLYRVIEFPSALLPLVEILGTKGLTVPAQSKDHVLSIIQKAIPVLPIQSDIEDMDVATQKGDSGVSPVGWTKRGPK